MWTTKPFGKTQPASANASAIYELYHFYLQLPLSWEEFLQLIKCLNWRSETLGHMDIDEFIQDLQNTLNSCAFSKKTTPWLCTPVCVAFGSETDSCSSTPMKMLLVTTTKVNARSNAERVTSLFLRVGLTVRFIGMLQRCFHIWPSVDHPRIRSISWKPGTGTGEFSSSTNHFFSWCFYLFGVCCSAIWGKSFLFPSVQWHHDMSWSNSSKYICEWRFAAWKIIQLHVLCSSSHVWLVGFASFCWLL